MSDKAEVLLGPPQVAARAAVEEGWYEDSSHNRIMGYGKGEVGCTRAIEHLAEGIESVDPNLKVLGVYDGIKPMGLMWLVYKGDPKRTAEIHATFSQKPGVNRCMLEAFEKLLSNLFSNGVYRVEAEPLRINKDMIQFLRHYGFKQEGIKRSAYWMDNNDYDTVLLRMLRREWTRKEH